MINIILSNKYMYTKDTNYKKMIKIFLLARIFIFFLLDMFMLMIHMTTILMEKISSVLMNH